LSAGTHPIVLISYYHPIDH